MHLRTQGIPRNPRFYRQEQRRTQYHFLGTPGIGKSTFAVYELYHAIKQGKNVVLQQCPSNPVYTFHDGAAFVLKSGEQALQEAVGDPSTLYVYDAGIRAGRSWTLPLGRRIIPLLT